MNKRFAQRVKAEREARGWSQPKFVELLEAQGVPMHATTVAKIEAGKRAVRIVEAVGIADVFGLSLDSLMDRTRQSEDDVTHALRILHNSTTMWSREAGDMARALDALMDEIPYEDEKCREAMWDAERASENLNRAEDHLLDASRAIADLLAERLGPEGSK